MSKIAEKYASNLTLFLYYVVNTETINPEIKSHSAVTLLDNIEEVVILSRKFQNEKENQEQIREELKKNLAPIKKVLGISQQGAILFSHILDLCGSDEATPEKLAISLRCSNIKFLKYMDTLDALEKKGLIFLTTRRRRFEEKSYVVPHNVIQSIRKGVPPAPARFNVSNAEELFIRLEEIFSNRLHHETNLEYFMTELFLLLDDNIHLDFCNLLKEYNLNDKNCSFFLYLSKQLVIDEKIQFDFIDDDIFEAITGSISEKMDFKHELRKGISQLFKKSLIEFVNDNGLKGTNAIQITQKARDKLFADLDLKNTASSKKRDLIQWHELKEKQLWYNTEETVQINRLTSLLGEQNYSTIVNRLTEKNMRTGFACLFSGMPGTGKTETAYQLARTTGRDIMPVEIAKTKSMWFGESEKIIKAIFDRYRNQVERAEKAGENTPILLFNEADAIISKRREISNGNLTQTENAIQNIILEELENMKGIMIATTNLSVNMDDAFQRRFLFKIEFSKPCPEIRQNIWRSLMPDISTEMYESLASTFDLSGGQIENIARKYTVEAVLTGLPPNLDTIMTFCREESQEKNNNRIGFTAGSK